MKNNINDFIVIKAFNNNIVLVEKENKEKLLFAKGIGFAKKKGDIISQNTRIDKVFVIENQQNVKKFNEIINGTDKKFLSLCEEIIYKISEELNEELNENIHVALTSHLSFALERLKNGQKIDNPFLIEIETLYDRDFRIAKKVAEKIKKETNILIPDEEVAFIALHINSARNNGKLSNAIKYSLLASSIVEYMETKLEVKISRKSLDYARFLAHIRFAIERIKNNRSNKNDLKNVIRLIYDKSYNIAVGISEIIQNEMDIEIDQDEVAYLAMHIERFRKEILNK